MHRRPPTYHLGIVPLGDISDGQEGVKEGGKGEKRTACSAQLLPSATHDTGGWLMV